MKTTRALTTTPSFLRFLKQSTRLHGLKLHSRLLLAPLAGISDYPYRTVCLKAGAAFTFTEMISARGLQYRDKKSKRMAANNHKKLGLQIFVQNTDDTLIGARWAMEQKFPWLDINFGCPAKKVVGNSASGAGLLRYPKQVSAIMKTARQHFSGILSAKIRSGYNEPNFLEIGKRIADAGADVIMFHPRLRKDFFHPIIHYDHLAQLIQTSTIPVIASGDLFNLEKIQHVHQLTGAQYFLIARGALGNPWIFRCKNRQPSRRHWLKTVFQHIDLANEYYGEQKSVYLMRKYIGWYLKGKPHAHAARATVFRLDSSKAVKAYLFQYL